MLVVRPLRALLPMQCVSSVDFPSSRMGNKALQAVQFRSSDDTARWYTFTFCMERIDVGPYKVGCFGPPALHETCLAASDHYNKGHVYVLVAHRHASHAHWRLPTGLLAHCGRKRRRLLITHMRGFLCTLNEAAVHTSG